MYAEPVDGGKRMTWKDPIVEEVRAAREAYAAKFNYDLDAIFEDIKRSEKLREAAGWKLVQPKKKPPKVTRL